MEINVIDSKGQELTAKNFSDTVFSRDYSEALVHQLVNAFRANARGGNRAQKNRAAVNFSTRKPWKQKGTGRARAGRASSPLWRTGGNIFPSSPLENFTQKVNKKMFKAGMRCIVSQLIRDQRLFIIEKIKLSSPKTKELLQLLSSYKAETKLIIVHAVDLNLDLASRNIANLKITTPQQADPVSLVGYEKTFVTEDAMSKLEELYT
jgi:large subunit ribosomal protein L4